MRGLTRVFRVLFLQGVCLSKASASVSVPLVRPLFQSGRGHDEGYNSGGSLLTPDPRGLALLRSPALRDRPIRTVAVVGQARTGKSFFMNSLASKDGCPRLFEVNATTEGLTKGIWLHHWQTGPVGPTSNSEESSPPLSCTIDSGSDDGSLGGGVATLLLDTEGLGAPGGDLKGYDSKLVAFATLISSVVFYNAMRFVNQFDVAFLSDVVLFDSLFRNLTKIKLVDAKILWIVQSFNGAGGGAGVRAALPGTPGDSSLLADGQKNTLVEANEDDGFGGACEEYPGKFLRPTRDETHDRIVRYLLQSQQEDKPGGAERLLGRKQRRAFCLPYPSRAISEPDLPATPLSFLDVDYRRQIESVRHFLLGGSVDPKQSLTQSLRQENKRKETGSNDADDAAADANAKIGARGGGGSDEHNRWMTGGELATLVERLVPRLNDMKGAAREVLSLHAEQTRKRLLLRAKAAMSAIEASAKICATPASVLPTTPIRARSNSSGQQSRDNVDKKGGNHVGARSGNGMGVVGNGGGASAPAAVAAEGSFSRELLLAAFNRDTLGDPLMVENSRERERLSSELAHALEAHSLKLKMFAKSCKPDSALLSLRDYYLIKLLLPVDALIDLYLPLLLGSNTFDSPQENSRFASTAFDVISSLPVLARALLSILREAAIASVLIKVAPTELLCGTLVDAIAPTAKVDDAATLVAVLQHGGVVQRQINEAEDKQAAKDSYRSHCINAVGTASVWLALLLEWWEDFGSIHVSRAASGLAAWALESSSHKLFRCVGFGVALLCLRALTKRSELHESSGRLLSPVSSKWRFTLFVAFHVVLVLLVLDATGVCDFRFLPFYLTFLARAVWGLAHGGCWRLLAAMGVIAKWVSETAPIFYAAAVVVSSTAANSFAVDGGSARAALTFATGDFGVDWAELKDNLMFTIILLAPVGFLVMLCSCFRRCFRSESSDETSNIDDSGVATVEHLDFCVEQSCESKVFTSGDNDSISGCGNNDDKDDSDCEDDLFLCGVDFSSVAAGEVTDDEDARTEIEAKEAQAHALGEAKAKKIVAARKAALAILRRHKLTSRRREEEEEDPASSSQYMPFMSLPPPVLTESSLHGDSSSPSQQQQQLQPQPQTTASQQPPYRPEFLDRDEPSLRAEFEKLFQWAEGKGAVLGNVEWGRDPWGGAGLFVRNRSIPAHGTVLSLPRSLRVGKEYATVRAHAGNCLHPDCPSLSALALLLLAWLEPPPPPPPPINGDFLALLNKTEPDNEIAANAAAGGGDGCLASPTVAGRSGSREKRRLETAASEPRQGVGVEHHLEREGEEGNGDNDDLRGWRLYTSLLPTAKALGNATSMNAAQREAWGELSGDDGERVYRDSIQAERSRADMSVRYIHEKVLRFPWTGRFGVSCGNALAGGGNDGNDYGDDGSNGGDDDGDDHGDDGGDDGGGGGDGGGGDDDSGEGALRWALCMVTSRTHGFGSGTERWLTPVLDLANHATASEGGGSLREDAEGKIVFRNGCKDLKVGDQVFLDYQVEDDEDLVAAYGFSLKHRLP